LSRSLLNSRIFVTLVWWMRRGECKVRVSMDLDIADIGGS